MKFKILSFAIFSMITSFVYTQIDKIDSYKTANGTLTIQPILHSSMVVNYNGKTIYVDPYGGAEFYKNQPSPDLIFITDIHGDHLNLETLESINSSKAIFITPEAVYEMLPDKFKNKTEVLKNKQGIHRLGFFIQAIAMYNLPETDNSRHPKGRGNGYILNVDDKRVYISGDTSGIFEMKMLNNIDIAFVCMNLPYTMDIQEAADAVLEFQPKIVYPFHYRGKDGFSDVKAFQKLVIDKNNTINVVLKNWYPID